MRVKHCNIVQQVFFFEAEDGIRDDLVTGVQTCALPIFRPAGHATSGKESHLCCRVRFFTACGVASRANNFSDWLKRMGMPRSEERRVGEEGRSRWLPHH